MTNATTNDTPTLPLLPLTTGVVLAILLMVSVTVVIANLVTDILHRLIDPRIERA